MNNFDRDKIFAIAIEREVEANRFYSDVALRAKNAFVKDTFSELAREELGHKELLERFKNDPAVATKLNAPVEDYKIAETEDLSPLSIDMSPRDAIALAMKKEERAVTFYRALSGASTDAEFKDTFLALANMELGHKHRLETLFVNVGYPEVF